jgi:hypothetical protein
MKRKMRKTKTILALLLLCSMFSSVAFAEQPWVRHTIQAGDSSFDGGDGARGKDIDNDGDIDFVVGAEESGVTRLYINPGPAAVTGALVNRR